jgi:hypothetical protein
MAATRPTSIRTELNKRPEAPKKRTVRTKIAAMVLSLTTVLGSLGMIGWHANAQSQSGFIPPGFVPLGMSINKLDGSRGR